MAHCAQIDDNGIVLQVIVTKDEYTEPDGTVLTCEQWCEKYLGGTWKQTSYNSRGGKHYGPDGKESGKSHFRMNYATVGGKYDKDRDAFIPENVNDGWLLDETTCRWKPPHDYPKDGKRWKWDNTIKDWKEKSAPDNT